MSLKDIQLTQKREDGKTYTTTVGTMEEDAKIHHQKMLDERARKIKWAKWRKKWIPRIVRTFEIIAILTLVGVVLYFAVWLFIIGIVLMAAGSGMSEGGRESQARSQYYNQLRHDRPTNNPKYWRK